MIGIADLRGPAAPAVRSRLTTAGIRGDACGCAMQSHVHIALSLFTIRSESEGLRKHTIAKIVSDFGPSDPQRVRSTCCPMCT